MKKVPYGRIRLALAIVFLTTITASIVGVLNSTVSLSIQLGPLWARLVASVSAGGIVLLVGFLAMTFVFGRIFCAVLCPFGTIQDIIALARPGNTKKTPTFRPLRYGIAFATLALLVGGWAFLLRYIDPLSRFGAMAASLIATVRAEGLSSGIVLGGLLPSILLVTLVLWKRRSFCLLLCPVGTVLGFLAKFGIFRIKIKDSCVDCHRCDNSCPTNCMDSAGKSVDAENCVLCLQCISICPNKSTYYGRSRELNFEKTVPDTARRRFLFAGTVSVLGAVGIGYRLIGNGTRVHCAYRRNRERFYSIAFVSRRFL